MDRHDAIICEKVEPVKKHCGKYSTSAGIIHMSSVTPFIYDQVINKIHYGQPDGFHGDIIRSHYRATGERLRGHHGVVDPTQGRIEFQGTAPPNQSAVEEMVKAKYGFDKVNPMGQEWNFSKVANDDPFYDPEFAEDPDWENKLDSEMKNRMANPPADEEIRKMIQQGVPKGFEGKGLQFADGSEARWVPDEFGSPHHDDVAKAMGKHREERQYMHVDPTGRMYNMFAEPATGEWAF